MARKLNLRIWRGDATDGGLKDVQVDVNEGEVVLDVIHRVQATQMGDLAVRWNCKAGKCGCSSAQTTIVFGAAVAVGTANAEMTSVAAATRPTTE